MDNENGGEYDDGEDGATPPEPIVNADIGRPRALVRELLLTSPVGRLTAASSSVQSNPVAFSKV